MTTEQPTTIHLGVPFHTRAVASLLSLLLFFFGSKFRPGVVLIFRRFRELQNVAIILAFAFCVVTFSFIFELLTLRSAFSIWFQTTLQGTDNGALLLNCVKLLCFGAFAATVYLSNIAKSVLGLTKVSAGAITKLEDIKIFDCLSMAASASKRFARCASNVLLITSEASQVQHHLFKDLIDHWPDAALCVVVGLLHHDFQGLFDGLW